MSNETKKDYLDSVESIAKDAKDREREGGDASNHIHESVDGSRWVIYTWCNLKVLEWSKNEGAAFDEMGSDAISGCNSFGEVTARLAYFAMRRDCEEALAELPDEEEAEPDTDGPSNAERTERHAKGDMDR